MFDDSQTNQTQDSNSATNGVTTPSMGLGMNPNPPYDPPAPDPTSAPQVVLPSDPATSQPAHAAASATPPANDALHDIKRQALEQLSPLVHQLEQTPEEKYKTLMMMIQASDNQDLITEAYQAAQAINDEKAKAEALLSIVNEINYFTQSKAQ